jgi:hypothetical protein
VACLFVHDGFPVAHFFLFYSFEQELMIGDVTRISLTKES